MRAANIFRPNELEIIDIPIPEPDETEVLIKVMASGICGTDLHIFRGEYMGDYPVIPGHEFSGLIEAVGSGVTRFKVGDRVAVEPNIACDNCYNCLNNRHNFCLNWSAIGVTRPGGMEHYVTAPEKSVFDIGEVPFELGALMEPLSCVIFGAGPIGILLMQVLKLKGAATVTVVEKNHTRASFAGEKGADQVFTTLDDLSEDAYDAVVDSTGVIAVMSRSVDYVRHDGKVLLFGVPPSGEMMAIEAFPIFRKGLTILSSFTSLRNSYQALDLLKQNRLELGGLVSHKLTLENFQEGLNLIETGVGDVNKVVITPNP
jgi:D-arabinitol dehydrogenase (NADP+)